jgi:hypothetical protein
MAIYKSKKNKNSIKSKVNRKKTMKKTRKRVSKMKGGFRGICNLDFDSSNDEESNILFTLKTGVIKAEKKRGLGYPWRDEEECVRKIFKGVTDYNKFKESNKKMIRKYYDYINYTDEDKDALLADPSIRED